MKCPKCKKGELKKRKTKNIGDRLIGLVYECNKCNYRKEINLDKD